MAKDKKRTAKVNGTKVTDGEIVTLVIQAKVNVSDRTTYNGTKVREVYFESEEDPKTFESQWFEADSPDEGKKGYTLSSATIVKVKP